MNTDFLPVFERLKSILEPYAPLLVVKADQPDAYYLDTAHVQKNKTVICFGGVQVRKNGVSYYLFPIYACPDMLASISQDLRKRMQGKSCFNFSRLEEPLMQELTGLTQAGISRFRTLGFIQR